MKHCLPALALSLLFACTVEHTNLVSDPASERPAQSDGAALPPDAAAISDGAIAHQPSARCGKRACACDDGIDNDGDGLVDGFDPECSGSFDDDEGSFGIGKPNKQGACRDCFWDDNAGNGDDGCRYPAACLTGEAPPGNGNCSSCEVSQTCQDFCTARTPNGCDCFGCCAITTASGQELFIELNDDCSLAKLDDPSACPRCVQDSACANPCGRCELCPGKTAPDLPADCASQTPSGPGYACDEGQAVCSMSSECSGTSYCQLGCCLIDLR